jgi:hypothetical protein
MCYSYQCSLPANKENVDSSHPSPPHPNTDHWWQYSFSSQPHLSQPANFFTSPPFSAKKYEPCFSSSHRLIHIPIQPIDGSIRFLDAITAYLLYYLSSLFTDRLIGKCVYLSGLIPEPWNAYHDGELLQYGIGFTSIVARTTKGSADLTRYSSLSQNLTPVFVVFVCCGVKISPGPCFTNVFNAPVSQVV